MIVLLETIHTDAEAILRTVDDVLLAPTPTSITTGAEVPPLESASGTSWVNATEIMKPAATAISASSNRMLRRARPATTSAPATFASAESVA